MNFKTEQEAITDLELGGCDTFVGMNCNDYLDEEDFECDGWDGVSRRCDCGNRRVQLLTSKNADGTWTAYGSAY